MRNVHSVNSPSDISVPPEPLPQGIQGNLSPRMIVQLAGEVQSSEDNGATGSQAYDSMHGNQMFAYASHFKITDAVFATGPTHVTYQGIPQSLVHGMRKQIKKSYLNHSFVSRPTRCPG